MSTGYAYLNLHKLKPSEIELLTASFWQFEFHVERGFLTVCWFFWKIITLNKLWEKNHILKDSISYTMQKFHFKYTVNSWHSQRYYSNGMKKWSCGLWVGNWQVRYRLDKIFESYNLIFGEKTKINPKVNEIHNPAFKIFAPI